MGSDRFGLEMMSQISREGQHSCARSWNEGFPSSTGFLWLSSSRGLPGVVLHTVSVSIEKIALPPPGGLWRIYLKVF